VISTASVPEGSTSNHHPGGVERMKAGSVIIDIAAEQGGNAN